ncbi:Lrp/AsnC family transcriptional regulator [Candidatus Woesearchaeota archaeon]|nr:Lrp/AsnC family transcriptional regulator [Candidatus Woesearchaeota archaeon]
MRRKSVVVLDEKDSAIVAVLKENAKLSTHQIAKRTRIPITTVHNRIKKLEKRGVIRGYTVILDNKKIGKPLAAFIMVTVDYKRLKELKRSQYELAKQLLRHPAVESSAMITGAADIIIKLRVENVEGLNEFVTVYLRNVEGVEKTQTAIVLNEA